jgi:ATP-dependent RNA helicase RhlE
MRFSDYNIATSIKNQLEKLAWKKPTDIQFKSIQAILDGEDVFAVAQTGTGKTAAFLIPIIHKLHASQPKKQSNGSVRALVLAPTRELAEQIYEVAKLIAEGSNTRVLSVMGGVEQNAQIAALKRKVDLVVATPGRIFDLRSQGYLSIDFLEFLVLDEADRMLDLGFQKDIEAIHKLSSRKRQTLFFSATITKKIKALAYDVVKDAIRIQISSKVVSSNVNHAYFKVGMDDKRFFLENILSENSDLKFVVFVRTKVRCERVVAAMERVGIKSEAMHGGKEQKDRFETMERFRNGENTVLITTDVAARGIDIPNVDYVINYDLPDLEEQYVHRVGRTGRGTSKGLAISFCSPEEEKLLQLIQEYIHEEIDQIEIKNEDYTTILKDTNDLNYNWQKLIDEANDFDGTKDTW